LNVFVQANQERVKSAAFSELKDSCIKPVPPSVSRNCFRQLRISSGAIAILSGDVVTEDPAIDGWKSVIRIFDEAKVPFVVTMGNHDAEHMAKDDIYDLLLESPYYAGTKGPKASWDVAIV